MRNRSQKGPGGVRTRWLPVAAVAVGILATAATARVMSLLMRSADGASDLRAAQTTAPLPPHRR